MACRIGLRGLRLGVAAAAGPPGQADGGRGQAEGRRRLGHRPGPGANDADPTASVRADDPVPAASVAVPVTAAAPLTPPDALTVPAPVTVRFLFVGFAAVFTYGFTPDPVTPPDSVTWPPAAAA